MKKLSVHSWLKIGALAALTVTGAASTRAQILWQNPVAISGTLDVLTNGTILNAYNFGDTGRNGSDVKVVDINGIYFDTFYADTADNWLSVSSVGGLDAAKVYDNNGEKTQPAYLALGANYAYVMRSGLYTMTNAPLTVTLSNLTPGAEYQVQIWINDSRTYGVSRSAYLLSPEADSLVSAAVAYNQGTINTLGNYIVGTFIADASGVQLFDVICGSSAQINALTLSVIPEPSAWALTVSGLLLLAVVGKKRGKIFA